VSSDDRSRTKKVLDPLRDFLHAEAAGGVVLVIAAVGAVIWANSAFADTYVTFWGRDLSIGFGSFQVTEDLQHWVNDALMAIFFFVVGLEIKRELVEGELKDRRAAALPAIAAVGGVLVPALIFVAMTSGPAREGWGIPMATDIAFAIGVLALLGSRVPAGAKLLLLTLAIVDDIIAISVIAIFYTDTVSFLWMAGAIGGLLVVVAMNRLGVTAITPYVLVGSVVWLCTLESGVHATIAGVALGLLTPTGVIGKRNVLDTLEHRLHPWSAFVIVPLFALANAGVDFSGGLLGRALTDSLTWAVAVGLVVGKIVGICLAVWICVRTGFGRLPAGVTRWHVLGVSALAGIGFTVSLFIAELAYTDPELTQIAKVGIFAGSLVAALVGALIMLIALRRDRVRIPDPS
jgi:NhaA family Na+:H+ antiporter